MIQTLFIQLCFVVWNWGYIIWNRWSCSLEVLFRFITPFFEIVLLQIFDFVEENKLWVSFVVLKGEFLQISKLSAQICKISLKNVLFSIQHQREAIVAPFSPMFVLFCQLLCSNFKRRILCHSKEKLLDFRENQSVQIFFKKHPHSGVKGGSFAFEKWFRAYLRILDGFLVLVFQLLVA